MQGVVAPSPSLVDEVVSIIEWVVIMGGGWVYP
jgi:hypothetical protein